MPICDLRNASKLLVRLATLRRTPEVSIWSSDIGRAVADITFAEPARTTMPPVCEGNLGKQLHNRTAVPGVTRPPSLVVDDGFWGCDDPPERLRQSGREIFPPHVEHIVAGSVAVRPELGHKDLWEC